MLSVQKLSWSIGKLTDDVQSILDWLYPVQHCLNFTFFKLFWNWSSGLHSLTSIAYQSNNGLAKHFFSKILQLKCKQSVRVTHWTSPLTRKEGYGGSAIEIINNTRGGIEGKIWERGDWGGGNFKSRMFTHSRFPIQKVVLDELFCFLKCFSL